jgi:hypothetical protein
VSETSSYHGYDLPLGMTPAVAEKIEKLIFGFAEGLPEYEGLGPLDVGIKIFEAMQMPHKPLGRRKSKRARMQRVKAKGQGNAD